MTWPAQLRWYLLGTGCHFLPFSVQSVLFPFLVAVQLGETAERVGFAQMAAMLPNLLLVLFGGLLADRVDQRKLLLGLHIYGAIPLACLAWWTANDSLSYPLLIAYALTFGALSAFANPTRDAMLNRIAEGQIQKTVMQSVGINFAAQLAGFTLAASAAQIGPVPLLAACALIMFSGALFTWQLNPAPPAPHTGEERHLRRDLWEGIVMVASSERMFPAFLLIFSVGLFFVSTWIVVIPLLIRDVYAGGAAEIAFSYASFMLGTVLVSVVMMRSSGFHYPGRALTLALLWGCLCLIPIVFTVPLPVFYLLIFGWGMNAAVSMGMSRTLMQESAPASHRARVMSIFGLGNMGGAPLGAVMMGYLVAWFGPLNALWVPILAVALIVLMSIWLTQVWHLERLDHSH